MDLATSNSASIKAVQELEKKGTVFVMIVGVEVTNTMAQLKNWVDTYKLTVTTVRDQPTAMYKSGKDLFVNREWNYILDLRTMKVVYKKFGDFGGATSVEALNQTLAEALRLSAL